MEDINTDALDSPLPAAQTGGYMDVNPGQRTGGYMDVDAGKRTSVSRFQLKPVWLEVWWRCSRAAYHELCHTPLNGRKAWRCSRAAYNTSWVVSIFNWLLILILPTPICTPDDVTQVLVGTWM
jgi:hypothetical protein